ncbi:MAG: metal-dependent hydrolase [Gemmatimonadota bacterium]|nr:metal-dependent hydrolase [Gemmatimonadota bacterium]
MMTQSHFLVSGLLAHGLRRRELDVRVPAFLVGSVAPDLPLTLLTVWFYYVPLGGLASTHDDLFGPLYDQYFFEDPFWIVSHNTLHAPLVLIALILVGRALTRRGLGLGPALAWFAIAALLHSAIDVVTHVQDGPLLFFPFEWSYRFPAPVSYWDPRHGGAVFSRVEWGLDLAIVAYFLVFWWREWRRGAS